MSPFAALYRHRRVLSWIAAFVCFWLGWYVGWTINAKVGAGLWVVSAALTLMPFLSHRDL